MIRARHMIAALLMTALCMPAPARAGGQVHVRPEATVAGRGVTLGDLATFVALAPERAEALAALPLGDAPPLGEQRVLSGDLVRARIHAEDPTLEVHAPDEVRVRPAEREIDDATVRDRVERAARTRMPWRDADVELLDWRLPGSFVVPAAATRLHVRFRERETFVGRVTAELVWLDPDRAASEHVRRSASVEVRVERPVVVAAERVGRGTTLEPGALRVERRDLRRLPEDALHSLEQAVGQRLRVAVRPGAPLLASYLDSEPVIERGDLVAVDAGMGPLRIQLMAKALAAGRLGDVIQLQNPDSRESFPGRVTGPRTAALALPGAPGAGR
jgi:flagella basal body P-ring formation protein FlgA